jgi:Delta14-sterol reductase
MGKQAQQQQPATSSSSSSATSSAVATTTRTANDKVVTAGSTGTQAFPYEFGGPVGAFITILALPVLVLLLVHWSHVGAVDFAFVQQDFVKKLQQQQQQQQQYHHSSMLMSGSALSAFWNAVLESPVLCPGCTRGRNHNDDGTTSSGVPVVVTMMGAVLCWFLFHVVLERVLPCELVQGCLIEKNKKKRQRQCNNSNLGSDHDKNSSNGNSSNGDGETTKTKSSSTTTTTTTTESSSSDTDTTFRLTYRINGHLSFWVTFAIIFFARPYWHESSRSIQFTSFDIERLYKDNAELALATILLCTALSLYLYWHSFSDSDNEFKVLAVGGDSTNAVYDFFMGRELNPRPGSGRSYRLMQNFDWKEFCELRPGLIGWVLLNMSCMKQQYNLYMDGHVSGSMILINLFQGFYVWDALYQERAILSTMDITTDGFGYMLVFGDLCWVPFTYSLQARYLVHHDPQWSGAALACIVALHMLGYYIFRSANAQKDAFRRNPTDPTLCHLQYLQTRRGTKLLTSGWWGMARKINYTGDWIMGLSWCLLCGFDSIVPYFYAIYFLILLIHRSIRDDHLCHSKYGNDWIVYKKLVPYRFIPGVV